MFAASTVCGPTMSCPLAIPNRVHPFAEVGRVVLSRQHRETLDPVVVEVAHRHPLQV